MTVTATPSSFYASLKVYVLTGADTSSPIGGTNEGSGTTSPLTTTGFSVTRAGSVGIVCASNVTGGATMSSSDTTEVTAATTGHNGLAGYKSLGGVGSSATMSITTSGTVALNWVSAEIRPVAFTTWDADATFAGAGSMTADARPERPASESFAGAGSMTAGASSNQNIAANLAGAGAMTSDGRRVQPGAFTGAGDLTLTVAAVRVRPAQVTFAGVGALAAVAADVFYGGVGSLVAGAYSTQMIAVTLTGAGSMTSDGRRVRLGTATFAGTGSLSADDVRVRPVLATFAGDGEMLLPAIRVRPAGIALAGVGLLTIDATHLGPLIATWVSPPKAIPEGDNDGSKVEWDVTLFSGNGIKVETSVDNGASFQEVTNGGIVPRLAGNKAAQAIITKVTLTRRWGADPTPRLHELEVFIAIDASRDEWCPLGVFTLNETNITDGPGGVEIELSGYDLSQKLQRNAWERIFTIDAETNFGTAIQQIISNRLPGAVFNFASTSMATENQLTLGAQGGDSNPLSDCLDIAEKAGMELFLDPTGVWKLQPEPDPEIDSPVWQLNDTSNPVMTEVARRLTDADVANYIIVTGESSSDAEPAYGVAIDDDPTSPTYYQGPIGQVVKRITSELIKDDDQAEIVAQAQLRRRKGGTEVVEIDAVPAAFLMASDIIEVSRDKSKLDKDDVLIDSVSMPLGPQSNMHLVTRRQKVADGRAIGGGVGGLNGDDGGSGGGGGGGGDFTPDSFTFAFSSCSNRAIDGTDDTTTYTTIKNANPDYFAHLGDVWYDDGSSGYKSHIDSAFSKSNFAGLISSLPNPIIVNVSDHDGTFQNNGSGASESSAVADMNSGYRQKFPDLDLPSNGIYRTWTRGRIRFILLDCITFKSALGTSSSSSRTMLGSTQKAWLKNLISSNDYPLIVMLGDSQWPGPLEDGQDEWRGYDHERQEMASAFGASPATLVYLNGDTHSLAYGHNQFGLDRLWQASPLKNNTKVKAGGEGYIATYPSNADEGPVAHQYGIISFKDDGNTISATFRGYGDGALRLTDTVSVNAPVEDSGSGGGTPAANIGALLKIGSTSGYNHFNIGVGKVGGHVDHTQSDIQDGYSESGYFELTSDGLRAKLTDHVNGGTTPGSDYPRVEFRELETDGTTNASWDPDSNGTKYIKVRSRVTHMPPTKPQLVLAQSHDGDDDTSMIYMNSKTEVQAKLGDTVVGTLTSSFVMGQDYEFMIKVVGNGSASRVEWYWQDLTTPKFTSSTTGRSNGWYFKAGNYGQSNTSHDSSSETFGVEMSKLECWRTGQPTPVGWGS